MVFLQEKELISYDTPFLAEHSPKDLKFDWHKQESLVITVLFSKLLQPKIAQRIFECSRALEFALDDDNTLRLHSALFCRVGLCPICLWRKSLMWRARFFNEIDDLIHHHPKLRYVFLTLTVKNCKPEDLKAELKHLNQSWDRLCKRIQFPANRRGAGYVRALEVTRNSNDNSCHPHFHVLMAVRPSYFTGAGYVSHENWVKLWQECARLDYLPSVKVRAVAVHDTTKQESLASLKKVLCEILKYCVEPSDLIFDSPELKEILFINTKNPAQLRNYLVNEIFQARELNKEMSVLEREEHIKTLHPQLQWLWYVSNALHKQKRVTLGGIFRDYFTADEPENLISEKEETESSSSGDTLSVSYEWSDKVMRYCKTDNT